MTLDEIFDQPLSSLLHLEKFVNDGSPSGFSHSDQIEPLYLPSSQSPSFDLPIRWLPLEALTVIGHLRGIDWQRPSSVDHTAVPFPVHPAVENTVCAHPLLSDAPVSAIQVAATSSTRTVVWIGKDHDAVFVKLHFPHVLGRFVRDLPLYKWTSSLEISRELAHLSRTAPPSFAFLPLTGGMYLEAQGNHAGGGSLLRSTVPYPRPANEGCALIPAFALWSRDVTDSKAPSILSQLYARLPDVERVLRLAVEPILQSYAFLAVQHGLIPEYNAQNVLLEVSPDLTAARAVHRDMADFFKDTAYRQDGEVVPLCTYHTLDGVQYDDTELRRSFAFDFKLCQYVIEPVVRTLAACAQIDANVVRDSIRELVRQNIHWPTGYFPSDGRAYGYERSTTAGRTNYLDLGQPLFR